MAGIRMEIGDDLVAYSHHFARCMARDKHATHEVCGVLLDRIKSALPYFKGKYDPHAYIEWELNVDNELKKYNLSKK
jgi:molybdopterin synthase catalytic subunit